MNELMERTPTLIATEINGLKEQARNMVLYHSIEIGRRLVEAKALIVHGGWGEWLENSVNYSHRTANNLMRLFEEYGSSAGLLGEQATSQAIAKLSYTQAVSLLALPADEREAFIENNDVENMSIREMQQAIRERDEALREKEQAEEQARQYQEQMQSTLEEHQKLQEQMEINRETNRQLEAERQSTMNEANKLRDQLKKAKNSGASAKEIERLNGDLATAQQQIKELTDKLEQAAAIEPSVVEIVPEEVKKEVEELRDRNKKLELKIEQQGNASILKFTIQFDTLTEGFRGLLGTLTQIKKTDGEAYEKYKASVNGLIDKMKERL